MLSLSSESTTFSEEPDIAKSYITPYPRVNSAIFYLRSYFQEDAVETRTRAVAGFIREAKEQATVKKKGGDVISGVIIHSIDTGPAVYEQTPVEPKEDDVNDAGV